MSHAAEHDRCAEDLGAFALGALGELDSERVERHLVACTECRTELEWMRTAVDALPGSVPQVQPSPQLRARVMDAVRAEAELLNAAGAAADRPARESRPLLGWSGWRLGGAAAALCAVAAVAIVLAGGGGSTTRTVPAELAASLRGRATAALRISGTRAQLVVARLPAPPADHVDELWVEPAGGQPRPAGTFVVRTGTVTLTARVRRGDTVLVTVEPGAGTGAPTSTPFLRATV